MENGDDCGGSEPDASVVPRTHPDAQALERDLGSRLVRNQRGTLSQKGGEAWDKNEATRQLEEPATERRRSRACLYVNLSAPNKRSFSKADHLTPRGREI
jgi:hypothetical protein